MRKGICWFRRDLRDYDHHALSKATTECDVVYPIFIFDENILKKLRPNDRRVSFIYDSVFLLHRKIGLTAAVGNPEKVFEKIITRLGITDIYLNEDYESYAIMRDQKVKKLCDKLNVRFHVLSDQTAMRPSQIAKKDGTPYKVFTAFKKEWIKQMGESESLLFPHKVNLKKIRSLKKKFPSFKDIGFKRTSYFALPGMLGAKKTFRKFLKNHHEYAKTRDQFGIDKTSHLSPHLRFGTISIRELVSFCYLSKGSKDIWLSELIWREFFFSILYHFPQIEKEEFITKYQKLRWPNPRGYLNKWMNGKTGYPLVDAAMRCLKETGQMPNRLRMVAASFLVKDLLVDWRLGEKVFAKYLMDYDLSANVSNWQWSAGVGVDAAPYFRIMNPTAQSIKFDPQAHFIRKWCPELAKLSDKEIHDPTEKVRKEVKYPLKIVDHSLQRERVLMLFHSV